MEEYNLREPEFSEERGSFVVKLYKHEVEKKMILIQRLMRI